MRKPLLALATFGLVLTAFGQGAFIPNNNSAPGYVDLLPNGATYTGTVGFEVWYKNGAAADNAINALNGTWNNVLAYTLLTADGFSLATSEANLSVSGGLFAFSEVDIKAPGGTYPPGQAGPGLDRTLHGGNVVLALVFWSGTANSFLAAQDGGIVSFVNPTSDWTIPPPFTPVPPLTDNFAGNGAPYTDLIMRAPEPSVFALAGLGAVLLLRHRLNRKR
jgi:hypothetical protein